MKVLYRGPYPLRCAVSSPENAASLTGLSKRARVVCTAVPTQKALPYVTPWCRPRYGRVLMQFEPPQAAAVRGVSFHCIIDARAGRRDRPQCQARHPGPDKVRP